MTKELRLPSAYVEVKENEMEYLDGSAWNWSDFGSVVLNSSTATAIGLGIAGGCAGSFVPYAGTAAGAAIGAGIGLGAGAVIGAIGYCLFGWWW